MGSYRSRLEIIADVLSAIKGGAKKTHVMYQANLSYKLLVRYLRIAMEADFVALRKDDSYGLTQKGTEFLREAKVYSERRRELKQQLGEIRDKKMILETRFINTRTNRHKMSKRIEES